MKREGLILIISAPSGAGKTTLCNGLLKRFPDMRESVSYTTRLPREGEVQGVDYHFITREAFEVMIAEGAFAEWAEVHGNLYGTALGSLRAAYDEGIDLVLDIDCQGAQILREHLSGAVFVFILPPSMDELRRRLESRSSDASDVIERRIQRAAAEIKESRWYDYIVINDNIDEALGELSAIVLSQMRRTARMLTQVSKLFVI